MLTGFLSFVSVCQTAARELWRFDHVLHECRFLYGQACASENLSNMILFPAQVALNVLKSLSHRLNQPICDQICFSCMYIKENRLVFLFCCPRVMSSVQNLG